MTRPIRIWTSLLLAVLFEVGVLAAPKMSMEYVGGEGDRPYGDLSLAIVPEIPGGWEWKLTPELRVISWGGIAKCRIANEIKVNGENGWDKVNLNYTRYTDPEDTANLYNLGYEHKSTLVSWWNPGSRGSWTARIKGEHKVYPDNPQRDYVSGEWELYSETREPITSPRVGYDSWSRALFDFAINRALEGEDWFLDGWVLGEEIINEGGEYQYPWAESADEITTKLISRASGGWSNHYRDSRYTWRVDSYELQWQQKVGRSSSFKLGYRNVEKNYPEMLTKGYTTREHLVRWLGSWDKLTVEAGGTYESKRYLSGGVQEDYQVWFTRSTRRSWPGSLKLQGDLAVDDRGDPAASARASYLLELPKGDKWALELQVGLEREWEQSEADQTTIGYVIKASRALSESVEITVRYDASREWTAATAIADWQAKIGLTIAL